MRNATRLAPTLAALAALTLGCGGDDTGSGASGLGASGSGGSDEEYCFYSKDNSPLPNSGGLPSTCPEALAQPNADWETGVDRKTHVSDLKFYEALGCEVVEDDYYDSGISCTREGTLRCTIEGQTYDIEYTVWVGGAVVVDGQFEVSGPDCEGKLVFTRQ